MPDASLRTALHFVVLASLGACSLTTEQTYYRVHDASIDAVPTVDAIDVSAPPVCDHGATRACFSGRAQFVGVGSCQAGTEHCVGEGGAAAWGPCEGEVLPQPELCDGRDHDCDGMVDNGCDCVAGATQACYLGDPVQSMRGDCRPGTQRCVALSAGGSAWTECVGAIGPTTETCDGRDNDCDGVVDQGCPCTFNGTQDCYSGPAGTAGRGPCVAGEQTCIGSRWGDCVGAVFPSPETCDGVDNDCDGVVDNGCACRPGATQPCYDGAPATRGIGVCHAGVQSCEAGAHGIGSAWGACTAEVLPRAEACNRLDDNCNGTVDEGLRAVRVGLTYSADLTSQIAACNTGTYAARRGFACSAAIERWCAVRRGPCVNSGFGPVESAGDVAQAACVFAAVHALPTTYNALARFDTRCNGTTDRDGLGCALAIDRFCAAMGAPIVGGYGPIELAYNAVDPGNSDVRVDCLADDVAVRVNTSYTVLALYHLGCNGILSTFGLECSAAVNRFCIARGFVSGVGPVETGALGAVQVLCVRP